MQDAFAHCEALVRAADKDRFLAGLFAPAEHRQGLLALYAFNVEVSRVREAVREPLAGEIRLQWWSDVTAGEGRGEVAANPVAAALLATMTKYRLAGEALRALVDARRFDLHDEPMMTLAEFESYADAVSCNVIATAAQILGGGREPGAAALIQHAGRAHAIAGLLRALPMHAARGQLYVPVEVLERHGSSRHAAARAPATPELRSALAEMRLHARGHLDQARVLMRAAPPALAPALLPVALVRPILTRMERPDYDPFMPLEIAQWRRQWLLWRAARRSARIFA